MALDPRIGMLNSGRYYAYVHGYAKPETIGTLTEVEVTLGVRDAVVGPQDKEQKRWNVTMRFAFPAWDEVGGLLFAGVTAASKSDAVKQARKQAAIDGHACSGRGRYWFAAVRAD